MKRWLFILALLLLRVPYAHGQATQISSGPIDPSTCDPTRGLQFYNTTTLTMKYCSATNVWTPISAGGPTLPNSNVPCATTLSFAGSINQAYSITLTCDVGTTSITGAPKNGQIIAFSICQDGTGSHTFAWPANFTNPPAVSAAANSCTYSTWKYDGTNWTLISSVGGAASGCVVAGANGDLQKNNAGACGASGLNDDGTTVTVARNIAKIKGPNPYVDATYFGVRATYNGQTVTGTCTMAGASTTATLNSAWNLVNGDGFTCAQAGPAPTMLTPGAPTVTSMSTAWMMNVGNTVANATGATNYTYSIVAVDSAHGMTAASATGSTATGAATLGAQTVNISSWTRTDFTSVTQSYQQSSVTVTTAAPHFLVVGALVQINSDNEIAGWYRVGSVPDNTHFSFNSGRVVVNGAAASGGATGSVTYWLGNRITWSAVTGAFKYLIYRGSTLIGVSMPETTIGGLATDPMHDSFEDYGSPITSLPNPPFWAPASPPVAATNRDLTTTVVSGAGTSTLTLAAASSNATVATYGTIDNSINIVTAAAATCGVGGVNGVLQFPKPLTGNAPTYITYGVTSLGCAITNWLSVQQSGVIAAGDTIQLNTNVTWVGQPLDPELSGSFNLGKYPAVITSTAYPMFWQTGAQSYLDMRNLTLAHNAGNAGVIWVKDFGAIPAMTLRDMIFMTSGTNDYTSMHFVWRNSLAGGANSKFEDINFVSGPDFGGLTPLFVATQGGDPYTFKRLMMNKRGILIGGSFGGRFEDVYEQAAQMPKLSFCPNINIGGGNNPVAMSLVGSIEDTTSQPVIAYCATGPGGGVLTGEFTFEQSNGLPGTPTVSGNGSVAMVFKGAGPPSGTALTQNTNISETAVAPTAVDGIGSTQSGLTYQDRTAYSQRVTPNAQFFVGSVAQAAPTCAVSAGGTVTLSTYTFRVAPVFATGGTNNGEGTLSPTSNSCTTTGGNQTITITWATVTGAIGYDIYQNGFAMQCVPPFVTGGSSTNYVWSGAVPCGVSQPTRDGAGPTTVGLGAVSTPSLKLNNSRTGTLAPTTLTAARTWTMPDATGNVLLDSTSSANPSPITQFFDNFSTGSMANYTNTSNTVVTSVAQFTGGTAAAWNSANLTPTVGGAAITYTTDQYAAFTLSTIGAGNAQVNVGVQMSAGALTGYTCGVNTNSNTMFTQSFTAGAPATIASVGITPAVGDFFLLIVQSSTVTCYRYVNGVLTNTLGPSAVGARTGQPALVVFSNTSKGDNFNAGNFYPLAHTSQEQDWTALQHFPVGITLGNDLGTTLTSSSGNSGRVQQSSGTLTNGNLAKYDANANEVDSGIVATKVAQTIASGTASLGTSAVGSGVCATVVTVGASGVLTTDVISATFNSDPSAITGYAPSASGSLYITSYPTANNVNFLVCNSTGGSITPAAATLNWRVSR